MDHFHIQYQKNRPRECGTTISQVHNRYTGCGTLIPRVPMILSKTKSIVLSFLITMAPVALSKPLFFSARAIVSASTTISPLYIPTSNGTNDGSGKYARWLRVFRSLPPHDSCDVVRYIRWSASGGITGFSGFDLFVTVIAFLLA